MERFTHKSTDHQRDVLALDQLEKTDEGYVGDPITLLARFEDFYHDLLSDQKDIAKQLEDLKTLDKTKTLRYKELFTKKLINQSYLIHLKRYGFKEE